MFLVAWFYYASCLLTSLIVFCSRHRLFPPKEEEDLIRERVQEYTPWDAQAQRQHEIQEVARQLKAEEKKALWAFKRAEEAGVLCWRCTGAGGAGC